MHADRIATTLAHRQQLLEGFPGEAGERVSSAESDDARVDLRLLRFAAERALTTRGTPAAHAWLCGLDTPDLRAGTVQDGTARGLMARYEEAISLCTPPAAAEVDGADADSEADDAEVIEGRELRRKRDILIASAGARIRFSRKQGIVLVDRAREIHAEDCVQFEDEADAGCLDSFQPLPGGRPRLFSPAFLSPEQLVHSAHEDRLVLAGRLGRSRGGFPCRLTISARKKESGIRLRIRIDNRGENHRLRVRFRGLSDASYLSSLGAPTAQVVQHRMGVFLATTLVRSCGRLRVENRFLETPGAQVQGVIEHTFGLGLEV